MYYYIMNQDRISVIVGRAGSGKSNLLVNIINKSKNVYQHIVLVTKSYKSLYDDMANSLGNQMTTHYDIKELSKLDDFHETYQIDKDERSILVIDDFIDQSIDDYINMGPQQKITIILITQSYFKIPVLWISNISYILLLKIPSKKLLQNIMTHYKHETPLDEIFKLYKNATEKTFDFFKVM